MKIKEMEYLISNKIINYEDSVKAMENRVEDISSKKKPELLWFLEHPPIYNAGQSSIDTDLLKKILIQYIELQEVGSTLIMGQVKELFI